MKIFLIILMHLQFTASGFAQIVSTNLVELGESTSKDWQVYVDNANLQIEYKFIDCDPGVGYASQYIVLRLVNKSGGGLTLNWDMDLYYNSICKTCGYPQEYNYIINLESNETLEGACDLEANYKLKIFSKFVDEKAKNNSVLTAFQLNNLSVTPY